MQMSITSSQITVTWESHLCVSMCSKFQFVVTFKSKLLKWTPDSYKVAEIEWWEKILFENPKIGDWQILTIKGMLIWTCCQPWRRLRCALVTTESPHQCCRCSDTRPPELMWPRVASPTAESRLRAEEERCGHWLRLRHIEPDLLQTPSINIMLKQ